MNAVLDVLKLRNVLLNYVSPPVCQIISTSGSGAGSISVEANYGTPDPAGVRVTGAYGQFLQWDPPPGLVCTSLYVAQNPDDPEGPYTEISECCPVGTVTVCSVGWWTYTTTNSSGVESAQSAPVFSSGSEPVQIAIQMHAGDTGYTLYRNPDPTNSAGAYSPMLSGVTPIGFEICGSDNCYRIQTITDNGASNLSAPICPNPLTCSPQVCPPGYSWDPTTCSCAPDMAAIVSPDLRSCWGGSYAESFSVSNGDHLPYLWSLASGSVIPSGMALNPNGLLGGEPNVPGLNNFTVQATNSIGLVLSKAVSLNVLGVLATIDLTQTPPFLSLQLPEGIEGVAYSYPLSVAGGVAPYSFGINGLADTWLTVSQAGVISGTPPPTSPGSNTVWPFSITVTDSTGQSCSSGFSILVRHPLTVDVKVGGTECTFGGFGGSLWVSVSTQPGSPTPFVAPNCFTLYTYDFGLQPILLGVPFTAQVYCTPPSGWTYHPSDMNQTGCEITALGYSVTINGSPGSILQITYPGGNLDWGVPQVFTCVVN
jgi:hypothetical protein